MDTKAYDGIVRVTSDDALALGREIGGKEGFLVGISSAAAIYGAIEVAKKLGTGKKSLQGILLFHQSHGQSARASSDVTRTIPS